MFRYCYIGVFSSRNQTSFRRRRWVRGEIQWPGLFLRSSHWSLQTTCSSRLHHSLVFDVSSPACEEISDGADACAAGPSCLVFTVNASEGSFAALSQERGEDSPASPDESRENDRGRWLLAWFGGALRSTANAAAHCGSGFSRRSHRVENTHVRRRSSAAQSAG